MGRFGHIVTEASWQEKAPAPRTTGVFGFPLRLRNRRDSPPASEMELTARRNAYVFVQNTCDQTLVREAFLYGSAFQHFQIRGRKANIDARVLSRVALGRGDRNSPLGTLILRNRLLPSLATGTMYT
jgi:hypothetical protein